MYVVILLALVAIGVALVISGSARQDRRLALGGAFVVLATLGFFGLLSLWGEILWFEEVGFIRRFWTQVIAQSFVMLVAAALAAGTVWLLTSAIAGTRTRLFGTISAAVVGCLWGAANWSVALRWVYGLDTGVTDPVLGMDTGFYLFTLPLLRAGYVLLLLTTAIAVGTAAVALLGERRRLFREHLVQVEAASDTFDEAVDESGDEEQPPDEPSSRGLYVPLGALAIVLALGRLLAPYQLMYSEHGVVHGPGWTDVHLRLPAYYVIAAVLAGAGLVLLVPRLTRALQGRLSKRYGRSAESLATATVGVPLTAVVLVWVLGARAIPALAQWLVVEPNELAYERPYLQNNIAFTRDGFKLAEVDIEEFPFEAELKPEVIRNNEPLLSEVRLWDPHAFDDVVQQFQALRLYYEITGADFDRYDLGGEYRQVMVAARELAVNNLPAETQTFVNRHFKYTHGYGLVMAPVSDFDPTGLPELVLRDLPPVAEDPTVRVDKAGLYYGELTNDYVVGNSRAPELDYPQGGTNVYTHYDGKGGVSLDNLWRKLVYGWKLGGTRLLLSEYPHAESRIMFRRNISERVATIAPFLTLDHDPYSVVVDGRIKWIIDAYTTSTHYPYSEPHHRIARSAESTQAETQRRPPKAADPLANINYIRNSVKAVVDAYDGTVTLYVFEPTDPVVQVWSRVYPDLFRPKEAMPKALQAHVRYPEVMLQTQGVAFAKYHMTDPVIFYNQEDLWVGATEKYYDEVRPVEPYYVMWQAPGSSDLEFILMQPFTPRKRQVLIGWIAGLCDGDNYGRMVAYRFPKDKWVLGPQQVDTKIDQSPELSAQLTLWDQHGKRVIRGNVLAIPIDDTILYVEPIYIQAQTAAYPELRIVVLMHGDNMSYAPTFAQALEGLVTGRPSANLVEGEVSTTSEAAENANRAFDEYLKLMSEGRFGDAGKQLEALRANLQRLKGQGPSPAR
ncbi:MAG TPA: UPF0182 family protein [Labilithrix sp.]|nr:UPF0182 family protein [Labilithrix sp.]